MAALSNGKLLLSLWFVFSLFYHVPVGVQVPDDIVSIEVYIADRNLAPTDGTLILTLWFNFNIYQWAIAKPERNTQITATSSQISSLWIGSYCSTNALPEAKIMLELAHTDPLEIESITIATSSGASYCIEGICRTELKYEEITGGTYWAHGDDANCPSTDYSFHYEAIVLSKKTTNDHFGPYKQIIYLDLSSPNTCTQAAEWRDATNPDVIPQLFTCDPTTQPSYNPSVYSTEPSHNPSAHPTDQPSKTPSEFPSKYPSQFPSKYPSQSPSKYPSLAPSNDLSMNPSHSKSTVNVYSSTNGTKSNTNSMDETIFIMIVVSIIMVIVLVVFVICIWRVYHNEQRKHVQGEAAVNNNNNKSIDEDDIMEDEEDSIDSLYVNKHANQETTTGCTVDGSNQGSTQVRLRTTGLRTRGANDKVLHPYDEGESNVDARYAHEGGIDVDQGVTKQTRTPLDNV
eukprot:207676_1